jgi:pimeloyl-ACP methyl ester carboxylesterase
MQKALLYFLSILFIWIFLSQCLIMRNRLSDKKAASIFESKNIPLSIRDTVITGRHIHYAVSGDDSLPTLVFIHGSPGSWMNYMKFMWDTAMRKKFRIVCIDRPGFGYSDFGKALHLQKQCELILPVLRSLKTAKPMYLCGHSLGGPVVVQLAASAPDLFTTIVIVAGAIDASQEKNETWRHIMEVKPLYWTLPGAFGPSNTELLYLKKDLIPLQEEFKKITCNVHFVHGDKDTWVPIENIAYGKKMMTHAQSITADTIAGADHQIPWKNKQALTNILLKLY